MDRSSVFHHFANKRSQPYNFDALWHSFLFQILWVLCYETVDQKHDTWTLDSLNEIELCDWDEPMLIDHCEVES